MRTPRLGTHHVVDGRRRRSVRRRSFP